MHLTLFHPGFFVPSSTAGAFKAFPWYLLNWKSWNIETWHNDRYAGYEGLCTKFDSRELDVMCGHQF